MAAAPMLPFIVMGLGICNEVERVLQASLSARQQTLALRQITTATLKPTSPFLETEFGICCAGNKVSAQSSSARLPISRFLPRSRRRTKRRRENYTALKTSLNQMILLTQRRKDF
jgi:hypothetical protein